MSLSEWVLIMITVLKRITVRIYIYICILVGFFSSFNFIHIYQNIQRYLTKNQKDLWQKEGVSQTVSVCLSRLYMNTLYSTQFIYQTVIFGHGFCNSSIHILSIVKYMQVVNRLIKLNIRLTINTLSLSHQTKKELEAGINDILNCYITIVFPTCLHPARKSTLIMHLIFI